MSLSSNGQSLFIISGQGVGEIRYPRVMRVTLRTSKIVKPLVRNAIKIIYY